MADKTSCSWPEKSAVFWRGSLSGLFGSRNVQVILPFDGSNVDSVARTRFPCSSRMVVFLTVNVSGSTIDSTTSRKFKLKRRARNPLLVISALKVNAYDSFELEGVLLSDVRVARNLMSATSSRRMSERENS